MQLCARDTSPASPSPSHLFSLIIWRRKKEGRKEEKDGGVGVAFVMNNHRHHQRQPAGGRAPTGGVATGDDVNGMACAWRAGRRARAATRGASLRKRHGMAHGAEKGARAATSTAYNQAAACRALLRSARDAAALRARARMARGGRAARHNNNGAHRARIACRARRIINLINQ